MLKSPTPPFSLALRLKVMLFNTLLLILGWSQTSLSASIISTFSDTNCQTSYQSLTGPNGYPDGTCTDLRRNGVYGSFQIISLDPGCAVTIYGNDTSNDSCSAAPEQKALGQPIACYNATYHYYSIDMCDPAAAQTSAPPTVGPKSHTGAIVGGVVGGVLGLALIVGAVFWLSRKKRFEQQAAVMQQSGVVQYNELLGNQQHELGPGKVVYKREAVEVEAPPVELGGHEVGQSGETSKVERPNLIDNLVTNEDGNTPT